MRVITISASYGAGGSIIAPMVADRLGVELLNRAVPAETTTAIDEAARADEDVSQSLWSKILEALASVPDEYGSHLNVPAGGSAGELRKESERRLCSFVKANAGGVVLGYAGALVLEDAFRVRLSGPKERRVANGMAIEGVDEATARSRLEHTDNVRAGYWKRLYNRDITDPNAYQLRIDSTVLSPEAVVETIVTAAESYWAANG